jgi:hypothetical protein
MAPTPGSGLLVAGTILSVIGVGIVLVRVFQVPGYWVPLIVGLGLVALGLVRKATARVSRDEPRRD